MSRLKGNLVDKDPNPFLLFHFVLLSIRRVFYKTKECLLFDLVLYSTDKPGSKGCKDGTGYTQVDLPVQTRHEVESSSQ